MKRHAILVNVSRGSIVDEQAVLEALENGHLAGYGADVVDAKAEKDKNPDLSPLWKRFCLQSDLSSTDPRWLNLNITPHVGGETDIDGERIAAEVIAQLLADLGVSESLRSELRDLA